MGMLKENIIRTNVWMFPEALREYIILQTE